MVVERFLAAVALSFENSVEALQASFVVFVYVVTFVVPWLVVASLAWWIVQAARRRYRRRTEPV